MHEPHAGRPLVQTEAQIALALVEPDELRDIGRRDAGAPQLIQPDAELILKCDEFEGIVRDHRLRHATVLRVRVHVHAGLVGWGKDTLTPDGPHPPYHATQ